MEEAEFQGFEALKTDIKAEGIADEGEVEVSTPVWHDVEGSKASATIEKPGTQFNRLAF